MIDQQFLTLTLRGRLCEPDSDANQFRLRSSLLSEITICERDSDANQFRLWFSLLKKRTICERDSDAYQFRLESSFLKKKTYANLIQTLTSSG